MVWLLRHTGVCPYTVRLSGTSSPLRSVVCPTLCVYPERASRTVTLSSLSNVFCHPDRREGSPGEAGRSALRVTIWERVHRTRVLDRPVSAASPPGRHAVGTVPMLCSGAAAWTGASWCSGAAARIDSATRGISAAAPSSCTEQPRRWSRRTSTPIAALILPRCGAAARGSPQAMAQPLSGCGPFAPLRNEDERVADY
jgi:hypothetical protein